MPKSPLRWLLGDRDPTEEVEIKERFDPANDDSYLHCSVKGCELEEHARWYCKGHFDAWDEDGRPDDWIPRFRENYTPPECSVKECGNKIKARNICAPHYQQRYQQGMLDDDEWEPTPVKQTKDEP